MKTYNLFLPVFKQGDDLSHYLETNNGHPVKSFLDMAEQYKSAAEICQIVADVLSKSENLDDVEVSADCHSIYINSEEETVASLINNAILVEESFEEDE